MKTKKILLLITIPSLLFGMHLFAKGSSKQEVKADASTTVTSNFLYDYENCAYGTLNTSSFERILSDGSKNINDVPLTLWDGENQDENISFTFSGNNSSYAQGNYLRGKYNGYLQMRYPSTVDGDGGSIEISPKNASYKITSITVALHSRSFTDSAAGESYNHLDINGVDSYSTLAELGYTSSNLSKTWTDTDGIDSFLFSISLKQSPVQDKEKYVMLGSVSVTYVQEGNVSLVSFDTQGGSEIDDQYIQNGQCATRPSSDPVKQSSGSTKYTFDDWYTTAEGSTLFDFSAPITGATTIYAHWTESVASSFTMSFETNGGSAVSPISTLEGAPFVQPQDPTRTTSNSSKYGFSFSGWFTDSDLKNAYDWSTLASGDITLYAKWHFDVYDNTPSGRTHYTINNGANTWASTEHYANDTYYQNVTLNSRETFETAGEKEEIEINIQSNNSSRGFYVHKVWSILARNSTLTIYPVDSSKVITYVRFDFGNWGDNTEYMSLYKNDSTIASDTDTHPNQTETTHILEASFSASENVKSVTINVGDRLIVLQNLYMCFVADPIASAAVEYAVQFNDAAVCGATSTDGLNETKWGNQSNNFAALDEEVRAYLTAYVWQDGANSELNECLERYDRVIYLHGEDYDFMGRIEAGKVTPKANTNSFGMNNANDGSSFTIVIVVSALSTSSLLFLIVCKRKRQLQK